MTRGDRAADAPGLPVDRPRERLLAAGTGPLSDLEILALVLGSAGPVSGLHAAGSLLARAGSVQELARCAPGELAPVLGPARAARLLAALELGRRSMAPRERAVRLDGPSDVYRHARPRLAHLTREVFHVLLLDARHRLIGDRRVAEGGLASCAISPRDVFEPAIREAAPAIVFVHNHPSGDPTPSREDVVLTERLAEGAKVLGITVVDHVVVADSGFVSLAELGKL